MELMLVLIDIHQLFYIYLKSICDDLAKMTRRR